MRRLGGWSPYEDAIGYSRAVVLDTGLVLVSGTTGTVDGVVRDPGDAEAQLRLALATVGEVLAAAGTGLEHVVRTRMYVTGPEHCDGAGRAHAAVFGDVRPAASMLIVAGLIDPAMVVEVEVEAVLPPGPRVVPA